MSSSPGPIATHVHPVAVRWGDCDPAGIVYYPRFFDYFHQAMETWFADALGVPYREIIVGRMIGFPSVQASSTFRAPSEFGERLEVCLSVADLGRSSIRFQYRVMGPDGMARVEGETTCVAMDLNPSSPHYRRAIPFPADLRSAIDRFRSA